MTNSEKAAQEIVDYIEDLGFNVMDDSENYQQLLAKIRQIIDEAQK